MHPKQRTACWLTASCLAAAVLLPALAAGLTYRSIHAAAVSFVIALFVAGLAAPLAVIVILISARRSRSSRAECPRCGYNLTGNRSGRCPECGRPLEV